jgi:hypothetical protein
MHLLLRLVAGAEKCAHVRYLRLRQKAKSFRRSTKLRGDVSGYRERLVNHG